MNIADINVNNIQLMQGDCLERMREIPDGSVDMVLCDPPYGTTACKWDSVIDLSEMWTQLHRIVKKDGAIVMTASQPFTTQLISSNIKNFKYCWIWKKPQGVDPFLSKKRPMNNIEEITVFHRKQPVYNPQKTKGKPYSVKRDNKPRDLEVMGRPMRPTETVNDGDRLPTRVLEFNQERGYHPTQKPVALMEYLIKTYTNPGDTVLDFTMGSGSTGVGAINTGRCFIGIERDFKHYSTAVNRILSA